MARILHAMSLMTTIVKNFARVMPRLLVSLLLAGWMGHASAAAITDTVDVDDREWAQVDLFDFDSWNGINDICPAGVCSGTVAADNIEYDLAGWTWASTLDVAEMFNYYIGTIALGAADSHSQENSASVDTMISDGWSLGPYSYVEGWTADAPASLDGSPVASLSQIFLGDTSSGRPVPTRQSFELFNNNRRGATSGVWLYRDAVTFEPVTVDPDPSGSVPTAGSFALFGLGFSLLLARRNRKAQR